MTNSSDTPNTRWKTLLSFIYVKYGPTKVQWQEGSAAKESSLVKDGISGPSLSLGTPITRAVLHGDD
jgi:hypothetical protein